MGQKISEKTVGKQVMGFLKTIPNSCFMRRVAGMSNSGHPDVVGCINGRHVEIELKRPGSKPTDLQLKRLEEWEAAGAIAFWVDNLDAVKTYLWTIGLWTPEQKN